MEFRYYYYYYWGFLHMQNQPRNMYYCIYHTYQYIDTSIGRLVEREREQVKERTSRVGRERALSHKTEFRSYRKMSWIEIMNGGKDSAAKKNIK